VVELAAADQHAATTATAGQWRRLLVNDSEEDKLEPVAIVAP